MLNKDGSEHPIPQQWRSTFRQITDAFVSGDFLLSEQPIDGVAPVDLATAQSMVANIGGYGDALAPLSEATWERSVYRWMDDHWLMVVDLSTHGEPVSDLTLYAKLPEGDDPLLEIVSVHVP